MKARKLKDQEEENLVIVFTDLVGSGKKRRDSGHKKADFFETKHKEILTEIVNPSKKIEIINFFKSLFNSNSSRKNRRKNIPDREIINGEIVRTEGDSYIFVFQTATAAVKFALIAQARHREVRKEKDFSQLHQFRVGIHFGAAQVRRIRNKIINISGSEVDLTSRIMSLCQGGQILCSRVIYDNAHLFMKKERIGGVSNEVIWKDYGLYKEKSKTKLEIYEVGEKGIAPFKKPLGDKKIWRIGWMQQAARRWDVRVALIILFIGFVGYMWYPRSIAGEVKVNGNPLNDQNIKITNSFGFPDKYISILESEIKNGIFNLKVPNRLGIEDIEFTLNVDSAPKQNGKQNTIEISYKGEKYTRIIQKLEQTQIIAIKEITGSWNCLLYKITSLEIKKNGKNLTITCNDDNFGCANYYFNKKSDNFTLEKTGILKINEENEFSFEGSHIDNTGNTLNIKVTDKKKNRECFIPCKRN